MIVGSYPYSRLRRNRQHAWSRDLVQETHLTSKDLIWPIFIREDDGAEHVPLMDGIKRYKVDELSEVVDQALDLGIRALALFPSIRPDLKKETGEESYNPENLVCRALRKLRGDIQSDALGLITDVALDPYTDHGHDGLFKNGGIDNDSTIEILCKQAINQAHAGSDVVAPSDMMDGRVGRIRESLDAAGFQHVMIIDYAIKYSSCLYQPFRNAVKAPPLQGLPDKKTYQLSPYNIQEAKREVYQDIEEGADMIIVKPGLFYLDVVKDIKDTFQCPTYAYQVSGEYALLMNGIKEGFFKEDEAVLESLIAFKRAGADGIWTYFAPKVAAWLKQMK